MIHLDKGLRLHFYLAGIPNCWCLLTSSAGTTAWGMNLELRNGSYVIISFASFPHKTISRTKVKRMDSQHQMC